MKNKQETPSKPLKSLKQPPKYIKIKRNKINAKTKKCFEYDECKCKPEDRSPCRRGSGCHNSILYYECDPKRCPAGEKCQNQHFRRGTKLKLKVDVTDSTAFGLFTEENISTDQFVIEYVGEVINKIEFNQRINKAKKEKFENYYFLRLDENLFSDASKYGNEVRFINHSCNPNVKPIKWTAFSNGQADVKVGFFALREIIAVSSQFLYSKNTSSTFKTYFFSIRLFSGRRTHI